MSVLTEQKLRQIWKKNPDTVVSIPAGTKITPSAQEYIHQKNIELKFEEENETSQEMKSSSPLDKEIGKEKVFPYQLYKTKAYLDEKPETMTAIFGNQLVYKDHPRIRFRGQLDSLEGEILYTIGVLRDETDRKVIKGLSELYQYVRRILRAEALEEELFDFTLLEYSAEEVRKATHSPEEIFGREHFVLTGEESLDILLINRLRTKVREVELYAYDVFRVDENFEREDILKALNRMSSGFYFLMFLCEGRIVKKVKLDR